MTEIIRTDRAELLNELGYVLFEAHDIFVRSRIPFQGLSISAKDLDTKSEEEFNLWIQEVSSVIEKYDQPE